MFFKRIGYYLIGVVLGSIAVYFFWDKKDATFDYGMDARTLKTIRIKERLFSEEAKRGMQNFNIDTAQITKILTYGDVDFGKSQPRLKPCAEYHISGKQELEKVSLYVIRCDSSATIQKVMMD